jgi:hypothetical protein
VIGLHIHKRGSKDIASEDSNNNATNFQKGIYMVASQALNLNNQVKAVPENIRQLVSLISSVIRRINEKQLDISGNKCLYINNNERNFNNGR